MCWCVSTIPTRRQENHEFEANLDSTGSLGQPGRHNKTLSPQQHRLWVLQWPAEPSKSAPHTHNDLTSLESGLKHKLISNINRIYLFLEIPSIFAHRQLTLHCPAAQPGLQRGNCELCWWGNNRRTERWSRDVSGVRFKIQANVLPALGGLKGDLRVNSGSLQNKELALHFPTWSFHTSTLAHHQGKPSLQASLYV